MKIVFCKLLGVTLAVLALTACHSFTHAYDERAIEMKPNFVPNSQAVELFKQKINYSKIITNISNEQKLLLNWEQYIRQSDFGTGQQWQPMSISQWQENSAMGTLSVLMTHGQDNLDIQVQLVSNKDNTEAVEFAVESLGVTSHSTITMNLDSNGPCDLTLYADPLPGIAGGSALCVLKNAIIRITASDSGPDIRSVLTSFIHPLAKGFIHTAKVPVPTINLSAPTEIREGDLFSMNAKVSKNDKITFIDASDNIKSVTQDGHKFSLKAITSGLGVVRIGVMNTQTLYVNSAEWRGIIETP